MLELFVFACHTICWKHISPLVKMLFQGITNQLENG